MAAAVECESTAAGPHSKAAAMQRNLKNTTKGTAGRVITQVASYGYAMGEENARGHLVITALRDPGFGCPGGTINDYTSARLTTLAEEIRRDRN